MAKRTTLILDEQVRRAARDLARHLDCSTSEAIRRAVLRQRDVVLGVGSAVRSRRRRALKLLIELFEGTDPEAEVRRLKLEDTGF